MSNILQTVKFFLEKNNTTILTGIGIAGVITTAIMTGKATIKANDILKDEDALNDTVLEKIKIVWKCYIPPVMVGGATIGCIIGVNTINERRNAALAGLYSIAQTTFKEYQEQVVKQLGENKERKIRDEVDHEKVLKNPPDTVIFTGGNVLCYDSISGRYFQSDIEKIKKTVNEVNRRLMTEMFISLNDLYFELGLSGIKLGDDMGFNLDYSLLDMNFSSQLTEEGKPCLVLNYNVNPR